VARQIVGLFEKLTPPNWDEALPPDWDGILNILTNELASVSIQALLLGLEKDSLKIGSVHAFMRLVLKDDTHSQPAREALLDALHSNERRESAALALVKLNALVVDDVWKLVANNDHDAVVRRAAEQILSNIGAAALPYVWAVYRDDTRPPLRDAGLRIFYGMTSDRIKDRLVELLTSNNSREVEMALTLFIERIFKEDVNKNNLMLQALLAHIQRHAAERTNLRVIGLLLLQRKGLLLDFLRKALMQEGHQDWLPYLLLLLGIEGGEVNNMLTQILDTPDQSIKLRAEAAAIMGLLKLDVNDYAIQLNKHRIPLPHDERMTRQLRTTLTPLDISLRALGGLLASGKWDSSTLITLYERSDSGSPERDLFSILLGEPMGSQIEDLTSRNDQLRRQNNELRQKNTNLDDENKRLKQRNKFLEGQLKQPPPDFPPPLQSV
jgi:hypothetical protein